MASPLNELIFESAHNCIEKSLIESCIMDKNPSGWLCIASEGATVRVGDRFNEIIGDTYVWPKTIPQARKMLRRESRAS